MKRFTWVFVFAWACGGSDENGPDGDITTTRNVAGVLGCTASAGTALALHLVADGFEKPIFVTSPPGDDRLFVVEQGGVIHVLSGTQVLGPAFLGISSRVQSTGNEQGLLGLAFHPGFANNGRFFVYYTAKESEFGSGSNVVSEFRVMADDPNRADPDSERRILEMDDPFSNHNGGMLAFGPADGYLYIGTGDGGDAGDPQDNGQNLESMLGKILRIDVDGDAPYQVPASNPYTNPLPETPPVLPEIWAYGLRNPWRFSFDRMTNDLYIGDVGQGSWEEVNFQSAMSTGGEGYGWDEMEGRHCFEPAVDCNMAGQSLPISEYSHGGNRCSITGGYVYRGECLSAYQGQYFFGDVCTNQTWAFEHTGFDNDAPPEIELGDGLNGISSYGENADGELFVVSLRNGRIYQVVAQ